MRHRNKLNSIAWLFRDGSIRKYLSVYIHIKFTLQERKLLIKSLISTSINNK